MSQRRHEIPTHLGVEDKAFYGLSVRQFMNLTAGFGGTYSLWNQWPDMPVGFKGALVALSLLVTIATTFVAPGGRPIEHWLLVLARYLLLRTRRVWKVREPDPAGWSVDQAGWADLQPRLTWQREWS
ncbi:MAG: hypothetical protein KGJ86_09865 [Chloroflexota bacterium]|nr:hypothetical protein [Chloroflexota bacterium]